jgi:tripartite-type tricarboxylate transporter receptor subunit TctC
MSRRDKVARGNGDGVPPRWCVSVTTARVPALPDTPTMAELGTKDLTFIGWFGLLAPVGTPPDILDKLNAEAKSQAAAAEIDAN